MSDFKQKYDEILVELITIINGSILNERNIFDLDLKINTEDKKAQEYIVSVIIEKINKLRSENDDDKFKPSI